MESPGRPLTGRRVAPESAAGANGLPAALEVSRCSTSRHGAFSDHRTNWEFVKPLFERQFTVCAIARRGRGETDATEGHSLEDESKDVVAVIQSVGEPVFLLGHSYGAQPEGHSRNGGRGDFAASDLA